MNAWSARSFKFLQHYFFVFAILIVAFLIWNLTAIVHTVSSYYDESKPAYISAEYRFLADESAKRDINDIINALSEFKPVTADNIPFTLANQTYWLTLKIVNNTRKHKPLILFADNNFLMNFDVFVINSNQQKILKHISPLRGTLVKLFPHYELSIPPNDSQEILIKLNASGPPSIPVKLLSPETFETVTSFSKLIYGIFIGGVLVMALYNLVLFIAMKDIVYLIYVGYLLIALMIMSAISGFSHLILIPELQQSLIDNMMLLHYMLVICLLIFTVMFLRFNLKTSYIFKAVLFYCGFLVACYTATSSLSHELQAKWFFSLMPVSYFVGLTAVFVRIRTKFIWAKYYVLSWIPLLLGSAVQPLVLLNIISSSFVTRNAFLFGVFCEVILMSLALAERIRRLEYERLNEVTYHPTTNMPRKSVLEKAIFDNIHNQKNQLAVLVISPESTFLTNTNIGNQVLVDFLKLADSKLNLLFRLNNAVVPLIEERRKVCIVNSNKLAILVDRTNADQPLDTLCKSIQHVITDSIQLTKSTAPLSCNIGVAKYPEHDTSVQSLIVKAVEASENARFKLNRWSYYDGYSPQEYSELSELASELKDAIVLDKLALFHQPQVDLKTRQVCSSECLARWNNSSKGEIPPSVFIPLAQRFGLMNELTIWVINRALKHQSAIVEQQQSPQMISINVSSQDIMHEQFLLNVIEIIESYEIPADKIVFELTDNISIAQNERAIYMIEQLQEIGITVSTNDFGACHADLATIEHYPFQELKLGREINNNIDKSKQSQSVAKATVAIAKGLNMEIVAEGIGNEQQEEYLRNIGCDIGQGFFYARPMSIDDYLFWLSRLTNGRASHTLEGELLTSQQCD